MATDDGGPTSLGEPVSVERLSPDTVRTLYDVHGRDLQTFLAGVLRSTDAAQDVCQITFQRLMEVGHDARMETIRGWLFKVAFHEAMAYRRKETRVGKLRTELRAEGQDWVTLDQAVDSLVQAEEVGQLRARLQELPPEQQHVVRQRIHEDKTFAVIAAELNVPLGTVLTRMRLAMQKLQKWLS
ncbi:MAG: RNA polymerase sigma factor [Planctomycetes bacterium]|nr:RNA polymerase sigma factor [Planctomycetota bacterium]